MIYIGIVIVVLGVLGLLYGDKKIQRAGRLAERVSWPEWMVKFIKWPVGLGIIFIGVVFILLDFYGVGLGQGR